jgi:hypothetical protein
VSRRERKERKKKEGGRRKERGVGQGGQNTGCSGQNRRTEE